ncbi:yeats family-domain-containing protein [Syncephalis plumigaleata]|nr:yeats family-domain-containing protein [Syncephalis plumigaleata]
MSGSAHKRIKGVTISRAIIFGNVASPLAKLKANESDHTHRWTVQVRGIGDTDLSGFIHSVTFTLHETYANPRREITKPPYEVTETGWGEFDVGIQIQFPPETAEKPVVFYHHLRLHPYEDDYAVASVSTPTNNGGSGSSGSSSNSNSANAKKKDVQAWCYDELIFHEPTEAMYQLLNAHPSSPLPERRVGNRYWSVQTENEELQNLMDAQSKINRQIDEYQKRMEAAQDEIARLKREVPALGLSDKV